jgi:signal transduction histidine kinase
MTQRKAQLSGRPGKTNAQGNTSAGESERAEQLADLLRQLDGLRDKERKDLSRSLHDTLVSTLSATKLECDWMIRAQPANQADGQRRLTRVSASLGEAIHFTRELIDQLWPVAVQHLGLVAAMQAQVSDLRARCGIEVRPNVHGDMEALPEVYSMTLHRAMEQAFSLLTKEAATLQIELTLRLSNKGVELLIALPPTSTNRNLLSFDSALMRERVLGLRGQYTFAEDDRGSARMRLFLPLPAQGLEQTKSSA